MSSTPSRLRATPGNSPHLQLPATPRTPSRGRYQPDARLSLKRVIGTTCASPTGLDVCPSAFAYIAGGAVVVVNVDGETYNQRFYRARPTAIPIHGSTNQGYGQFTPSGTPKANDSRNRVPIQRESSYDRGDSSSKTWTSRERIKAATCLSLSRDGRFLAVGETGYSPRVLIFGLQDNSSSDRPLVSISEHHHGVTAVAFAPNGRFLASLGHSNDGFLYLWKIDPKTGATRIFQQNRCVSTVRGMIWMGNNVITLGVRHVKLWKVEEQQSNSPTKSRFGNEVNSPSSSSQKALPGRNALLGDMLDTNFTCAAAVDHSRAIICSHTGDVCLLDDTEVPSKPTEEDSAQAKSKDDDSKGVMFNKILEVGFAITCVVIRDQAVYVSGRSGNFAVLDLGQLLQGNSDCITSTSNTSAPLLALGFLENNLVTVDNSQSIDIWNASHIPGQPNEASTRMQIPGNGDATKGVSTLPQSGELGAAFYTWSRSGNVRLWDTEGNIVESFDVALEAATFQSESEPVNELSACAITPMGDFFITGDNLGVLKVIDAQTKQCVFETKAHSGCCQYVTSFQNESKFIIASCGRDRTAQLFHRASTGRFQIFQTLEFSAKVNQVIIPTPDRIITSSMDRSLQMHEIVCKESNPDDLAAFFLRSFPVKTSPSSFVVAANGKSIIVALLDRSACIYDFETSKLIKSFKCTDEAGVESVVLDSLIWRPETGREPPFLLGISNTDKSVRLYNAATGNFLDREWGHTEGIIGMTLIEQNDGTKKVASVGSDGTLMIWSLELEEQAMGSNSRDPSPGGDVSTAARAPLRRIRSKASLAEFQRPASVASGRRSSPPHSLTKKRSLYGLTSSAPLPSPTSTQSPSVTRSAHTRKASSDSHASSPPVTKTGHTRKASSDSQTSSPPISPKVRLTRRPSEPAKEPKKTKSISSLRGAISVTTATEDVCKSLRNFRLRLEADGLPSGSVLAELDNELRLTSLALGEEGKHSRELSASLLEGILDHYSNKLSSMLDEKLDLKRRMSERQYTASPEEERRPISSGAESLSTTDSNYS